MKNGKILVNLALMLVMGFPIVMTSYMYYTVGDVNGHYAFPRLLFLFVLSVLVYRQINWARWLLVGVSVLVILGDIASVVVHFYTQKPGNPSLLLFAQFAVYLPAVLLLTWPESVRNLYSRTKKN